MRFFGCLVLLLASAAAQFLSVTVYAQDQAQSQTFRISDIRVEGLQRVSAGTVFTVLPVRVGDVLSQADIQNATRELFKVGYFADVAINRDGDVLVLVLKERPAINKIEFEGNKAIKTDSLMDSLKKNNLSEGQIFQRATLEGMTQALQREYIAQGRYGAAVLIEVEDLPRNQVKVKVKISEGSVARIKQINIVGNKVFSDQILVDLFELKTTGLWSWFSGNDKYSKEKMKGDLERIESYYMDRGYLAFKAESSQISLSPDKSKIFITVNVSEGDVYKVNDVQLAGDPVIDEAILRAMILVKKEQIFSQILMTTSSEYIKQRLGNEGYTFAKVEGIPERNETDKTVKITFFIEPGKRAYVNRIIFQGNTKTVDEVLRREMRQMEGGSASTAQIENSKVHLERLGFFKEVKVDTKEVPGSPDKVDVEYTVEEQSSGSMNLTIGYAQYSGLTFSAGIQQSNWFGTGKSVGIGLAKSKYQTSYNLKYNDPYFTPDGISRGFSLSYETSDSGAFGLSPYSTNVYGATVNFGYPISEIERIGFSLGLRNFEVTTSLNSPQEIIRSPRMVNGVLFDAFGRPLGENFITKEAWDELEARKKSGVDYVDGTYAYAISPITDAQLGPKGFLDRYGDTFNDAIVNLSWVRSTLNRGVLPDRGASQSLSGEASLPGGDLQYYKLDYNGQLFQPLTQRLTLRVHGHLGYADAYGNMDELPFFENFRGGGFGSVRGFESQSLGPRSTVQEAPRIVYGAWDDINGDGIQDSAELSQLIAVMCDDPAACHDGQIETYLGQEPTRRRGAFGGNVIIDGGAEILFPLPFIKDQRSLQASFFLDVGNVFDTDCGPTQKNCFNVSTDQFKGSVGVGLVWLSSFGPMTFSMSEQLGKESEYDAYKFFQFSLGQTF